MSVGYPATISGLNFDQFSALQDFQFENYKANPISFALLLELLLRNHLILEFQLTHSNFSLHIVFKSLAKIMHWAVKNMLNILDFFFIQNYEISRTTLIIKMFCLLSLKYVIYQYWAQVLIVSRRILARNMRTTK